jgi:enoyl-CoA hydratase/3-hydroxyacyl-CoA dehydrogenase
MQAPGKTCSGKNVKRLLDGLPPEGVDEALAAKTAKVTGFKAPVAVRLANEIIDAQAGLSIADAAEIELGRLGEIFATEDALEGLTSMGRKRPAYTGR